MKYNKRKYKYTAGIQAIANDTPDYSSAYKIREEQNAKNQIGGNIAATAANIAVPGLGSALQGVGAISDSLTKDAKGNYKNKFSEAASLFTNPLGTAGKTLSALTGNKTAAADLFSGSLGVFGIKNPFGKTTQEKIKDEAIKAEKAADAANFNKTVKEGTSTDAQSFLAKKGKYKVKTKQPRLIETEGREPIFSPKKADGTRDLLYYNPNDPTHEEGGVKAVVMPRNRYNNGTSNLMPKRSKVSLLGSGNMAVGAKQVKVSSLNNAAFSSNLTGMPSANAANKFVQPLAGTQQVARNIPEDRRKEKIRTPRSHKKSTGPVKTVDPPMLYEMKPPPPRSTFNTKNDFKKGGKYIKTYQLGTDGTEAGATYKHNRTFTNRRAFEEALQAHDDSLNLYGQSRYFTDLVTGSGLYQPTVEHPPVKDIVTTGRSTTSSPTKKFGAPDDRTEEFRTVKGIKPKRKDLYSRKESGYKSFEEWEKAKASGQPHGPHEGYEINMYRHPEMSVSYKPKEEEKLQPRQSNLRITSKDSTVVKPVVRPIIQDSTKKTPTKTKTRGKFVAEEKGFFEELGDRAREFLEKIGPSTRMSNGKRVRVFK
jgi:hypothetical protein